MNPNWSRWIWASILNHFKDVANGIPLPMHAEGVDERDAADLETNHVEVRVNGPFVRELSRNYFKLDVDINLLLFNFMSETAESGYDLATWSGIFQAAAEGPINIYKFGGELVDDSSYVGCLTLRHGKYDSLRLLYFGQTGRVERLRQSMVDAKYAIYLMSE